MAPIQNEPDQEKCKYQTNKMGVNSYVGTIENKGLIEFREKVTTLLYTWKQAFEHKLLLFR